MSSGQQAGLHSCRLWPSFDIDCYLPWPRADTLIQEEGQRGAVHAGSTAPGHPRFRYSQSGFAMAYAVLLMIGGTLLLNGLAVLGVVEGKSIALFNIFTGLLATVTPFYLLTRVSGTDVSSLDKVLSVAPMWLFALTFLWVGVNALTGHDPAGVGWYCLWVAVAASVFAGVNLVRLAAPADAIIWANWALLWAMFWVLLGLGKERVGRFTGWLAVILSVWSVSLQGLMGMLGAWPPASAWVFVAASLATILFALGLAIVGRRSAERRDSAESAGTGEVGSSVASGSPSLSIS